MIRQIFPLFAFVCLLGPSISAQITVPAAQQRQADYRAQGISANRDDKLILQAYNNDPLDSTLLADVVATIPVRGNIDFELATLLRCLINGNGAYDTIILPSLLQLPFWMNKGDTAHGYWSENHGIQWMSGDWLLHEYYQKPIDDGLRDRLVHYLKLKRQYGFYEFFSTTYATYSLNGLLNLAEYAQDAEVKSLATEAALVLMKDQVSVTTAQGVCFPIAGRSYYGRYEQAYSQNTHPLLYMLLGLGDVATGLNVSGALFSTSNIDLTTVLDSWKPVIDTSYYKGHDIATSLIINDSLRPIDKTVSIWSSGGYFMPEMAAESATLIHDSLLWDHVDFGDFKVLQNIPLSEVPSLSESLSPISRSTLLSGVNITHFKHYGVQLMSLNDFWKGKLGYQQFPIVATVGRTAVFPASGVVKNNWENRSSNNANAHLPNVAQKHNVALVMYWPEPGNFLLSSADVSLHWFNNDFDEVVEDDLWLLGRQDSNYVAVRRTCTGEINSWKACPTDSVQTWAVVVGDSLMYGSFANFKNLIAQAQLTDSVGYDAASEQNIYYAKIQVDTITVDYTWTRDSISTGIINSPQMASGLKMYPNPANSQVTLEFENKAPAKVAITNLVGQHVHQATVEGQATITTTDWPQGIYLVHVETAGQRFTQKLVKVD